MQNTVCLPFGLFASLKHLEYTSSVLDCPFVDPVAPCVSNVLIGKQWAKFSAWADLQTYFPSFNGFGHHVHGSRAKLTRGRVLERSMESKKLAEFIFTLLEVLSSSLLPFACVRSAMWLEQTIASSAKAEPGFTMPTVSNETDFEIKSISNWTDYPIKFCW